MKSTGTILALCFSAILILHGTDQSFATSIDLTGSTLIGNIGTAIFQRTDDQSTGTGIIDPFLSMKVRTQSDHSESGFNTDYSPLPLDAFKGGAPGDKGYTRSLLLSEVSKFAMDFGSGLQDYRLFLLDINEDDNPVDKYLSLNDLKIYLGTSKDPSTLAQVMAGTLVYQFGPGDEVLLDAKINHGSGSGDMFLWVPDNLFTGSETQQVYLYSQFGTTPPVTEPKKNGNGDDDVRDYSGSDGFEEWAVLEGGSPQLVPEPSTVLLLGAGLACLGFLIRRKF